MNFEQRWQSLSAVQNYSSKIEAPRNRLDNFNNNILWVPFLYQPPTHSLLLPLPRSFRKDPKDPERLFRAPRKLLDDLLKTPKSFLQQLVFGQWGPWGALRNPKEHF